MTEPSSPLTPREVEIAKLLAMELSYAEIGRRLGCSPFTVRTHVYHIAAKLGADRFRAKRRVERWAVGTSL